MTVYGPNLLISENQNEPKDPQSALEIKSSKGFLPPRLSQAEIDSLKSGLTDTDQHRGMIVVNKDENQVLRWDGVDFVELGSGAGGDGVRNLVDSESSKFEDSSGTPSVGSWIESDDTKITITASATTPLLGAASGVITKLAVDASGANVNLTDLAIDLAERGKPIVLNLFFDATAADYVSEDLAIEMWDVTGTPAKLPVTYPSGLTGLPKSKGEFKLIAYPDSDVEEVEIRAAVIADSATSDTWAVKVDGFVANFGLANNVGAFSRSEEIDVTGSGDFTAGSIRVSRQGSSVTISFTEIITFSSSTNPASASGLIPSWAIPTLLVDNGFTSGSTDFSMRVATNGVLSFTFSSARTNYTSGTISYTVDDDRPVNVFDATEVAMKGSISDFTHTTARATGSNVISWDTAVINGPITYSSGSITFTKNVRATVSCFCSWSNIAGGGPEAGNVVQIAVEKTSPTTQRLAANGHPGWTGSITDRQMSYATTVDFKAGDVIQLVTNHNKGSDASVDALRATIYFHPDLSIISQIASGKSVAIPEVLRTAAQRTVNYSTDEYIPVVASGSNSDGEWVRYADGTQVCHIDRSGASNPQKWTFPMPFSSTPTPIGSSRANAPRMLTFLEITTTDVDVYVFTDSGGGSASAELLSATGRWK